MKNKIALGTFPFSGWFGRLEDTEIINLTRTFIDAGGHFIDTAPLYGFGKSETLLGEALKPYNRKDYALLTKCGFVNLENCATIEEAKTSHKDTSYNAILKDCEKSLERMRTDYIDVYLLHTSDGKTPIEESISALDFLRTKKKVKAIGVCNTTLAELKNINSHYKIDFIQNRFSVINRSITSEFASYLLENKIYLTPYRVIDYGLLTDKSTASDQLSYDRFDLRSSRPDLQIDKQQVIVAWIKEYLAPIAHSLGITVAQLCIAWTLRQPYVGMPVIGATQKKHIVENLQSNTITLSDAVLEQIEEAYSGLESMIWQTYSQPVHTFRGLNDRHY